MVNMMRVLQTNLHPIPITLGYCLVLCGRNIYLSIWVLLGKKYSSPLSNRE
jgi:hypothetical protein